MIQYCYFVSIFFKVENEIHLNTYGIDERLTHYFDSCLKSHFELLHFMNVNITDKQIKPIVMNQINHSKNPAIIN